jgi:Putative phage tail protein
MGFALFVLIASIVIGQIFKPRISGINIKPSSLGEFDIPTAEEGRVIPYACGTCHIKGPNVVWYGDFSVFPHKTKQKQGLFGPRVTVKQANLYRMGIQFVICQGPIDELLEIRFDDRPISAGAVVVAPGQVLRVHLIGDYSVPLTTTTYLTSTAFCTGVANDIRALAGGFWKLYFGYQVIPGVSDEVNYFVKVSGVGRTQVVKLKPGIYTAQKYHDELCRAINAYENSNFANRVTLSGLYDPFTNLFSTIVTRSGSAVEQFTVNGDGYAISTAIPALGWQRQSTFFNTTSFPATKTSDYATFADRLLFTIEGTSAAINWTHPDTNTHALFGVSPSSPDWTVGSHASDYAQAIGGETTQYLPYGTDFMRVLINALNLFGGEDSEGGIEGAIDIHYGSLTQNSNDYLESVVGLPASGNTPLPGYRGVCYAVARHLYVGTSKYLKPISFIVRRCPNSLGLASGKHNIAGDANAACVIYDVLVDCMRVPTSLIDATSFTAVGNTLYTEGLGISMVQDSATTAFDFIREICRHIDGVVYIDPATGKFTLALARADYNPATILQVNEDDVRDFKFTRPSFETAPDAVKVLYIDRAAGFVKRPAQEQNNASIQSSGTGVPHVQEIEFLGISTNANAQKVAARSLNTLSAGPMPFRCAINRRGYAIHPGSVFRLTFPSQGISQMVVRVINVEPGVLEDGWIVVDAAEDIFATWLTSYSPPGGSGWVDPVGLPAAPVATKLLEVPYAGMGSEDRNVMTLFVRGAGLAFGYDVYSDISGNGQLAKTNDVTGTTPSGTLTASLSITATSCTLGSAVDLENLESASQPDLAAGKNLLLIDDEWIAWSTIIDNGDGTFTLSGLVRGVMDTLPAAHSSAARAYFASDGAGLVSPDPIAQDGAVTAALLTVNNRGVLSLGAAAHVQAVVRSRAQRPNVPRDVKINGSAYPASIPGGSDIAITWAHRNRLGTWSYDTGGVTSDIEPGTAYRVRIYGNVRGFGTSFGEDFGGVIHLETGLTGLGFTYTAAAETADVGSLSSALRVVVEAYRISDGLTSYVAFDHSFTR